MRLFYTALFFIVFFNYAHSQQKIIDSNYQKQIDLLEKKIEDLQKKQDNLIENKKNAEIYPKYKFSSCLFMGYSNNLKNKKERYQGFDIYRAYLGFDYKYNKNISSRILIDAAPSSNLGLNEKKEEAFKAPVLKNAYIKYTDSDFTLFVGMIGTPHVGANIKYWQYIYIAKTMPVLNKLIKGVDIGIRGEYKINPFLAIDASILKGSGYRKISKNSDFQYVIGTSITPLKGLLVRILADVKVGEKRIQKENNIPEKSRKYLSFFTGYSNSTISGGFEFSKVFHDEYTSNNKEGYSLFINGKLSDQLKLIGRVDLFRSQRNYKSHSKLGNKTSFEGDSDLFIVGFEYILANAIHIAPNYSLTNLKKTSKGGKNLIKNNLALSISLKF